MRYMPVALLVVVCGFISYMTYLHGNNVKEYVISHPEVKEKHHSDDISDCFVRQNRDDYYFYLATFREDGSYVWVGSWGTLTLALKAGELLNCHIVVDPSHDTPKPVVARDRKY